MRTLFLTFLLFIISSQWVIYRKGNAPKRKIVCKPDNEWETNAQPGSSSPSSSSSEEHQPQQPAKREASLDEHVLVVVRKRRDVEIDPNTKEPIIFLGQKTNVSTTFVDDGDFDLISDYLTSDELKLVKQQIMNTCNYLDRDRHHETKQPTTASSKSQGTRN
ncbi:unnamed protein product, partial [Mesorhabditis belari]|uniref:Uncharacterized protein n=1 Tax=Mesorhabditis belari TaxID=2138241 RepID=A0AAF3FCF1_9BILA